MPLPCLLVAIGFGLADEAYDEVPDGVEVPRFCPVRRLDAYHRLMDWILVDAYNLPTGKSMRDAADEVHAATRARWKERCRLPRNLVPQ